MVLSSINYVDSGGSMVYPSANITVTVNVGQSLIFSYAEPVQFTMQPGTSSAEHELKTSVTTNAYNGFNMFAQASKGPYEGKTYNNAPALEFSSGSNTYTIPAFSGISTMADGKIGWGIGCSGEVSGVTCENGAGNYVGMVTEESKKIASYDSPGEDIDVGLLVGASVDTSQVAGTYTGLVQLTAIVNE